MRKKAKSLSVHPFQTILEDSGEVEIAERPKRLGCRKNWPMFL